LRHNLHFNVKNYPAQQCEMYTDNININGNKITVHSFNTVIVGTGAAGFNAADTLYSLGQKDIAIVTEGINMGTSRNTGSDKQTYYKLTLAGDTPDSVKEMAETLFGGGSMHGDIALIEAALSAKSFYKLAEIGVPFPHNKYGEYIGYKTDHDPRQRATSAGPLTSKYMTERLEAQVKQKGIKIFDRYQVIGILTDRQGTEPKAAGLIALDLDSLAEAKVVLFNCTNIIYATGGPAGMYLTSVYPESQSGASGIAFEAGAKGINLTESQYGIASIKFRWNLSGTYQQVIPRYISTDANGGDEKEFLDEYFDEPGKMLDAIFLKGYQWPFDPRKISNFGSSLIDILVYNETQIKGRRVFLDFTRNPSRGSRNGELDFSLLGKESYEYLKNSNALFGTPIERLKKMNRPAIDLYMNNGIDLTKEYLEIAVCAQHNNGGLMGNIWWESNLRHFFPVGEVNGTFGVYRPGGSALNSTQVGSLRAAQYICCNYREEPPSLPSFLDKVEKQVADKLSLISALKLNTCNKDVMELKVKYKKRMTKCGAHIRSLESVESAITECINDLKEFASKTAARSTHELSEAFKNRDILITQFVYLNAIREYIKNGGRSRGSYLVKDPGGILPIEGLSEEFRFTLDSGEMNKKVCEIELKVSDDKYECSAEWKPVRPIPAEDNWFENVWNDYMKGRIIV
jgi:succinate dehydrogenase/fumarate reductase flavoprotein subunit